MRALRARIVAAETPVDAFSCRFCLSRRASPPSRPLEDGTPPSALLMSGRSEKKAHRLLMRDTAPISCESPSKMSIQMKLGSLMGEERKRWTWI